MKKTDRQKDNLSILVLSNQDLNVHRKTKTKEEKDTKTERQRDGKTEGQK